MVKPWAQPFRNRGGGKSTFGLVELSFFISWWLGAAFAVLGIISGATNTALGLHATHWLLLSIAAFLAGIPMVLTRAVPRHLLGTEDNSKKEQ